MNKLIKIKENYYVIDDSEIKEGDWYLQDNKYIYKGGCSEILNITRCKKITHSTQEGIGEQLNLNDIEELVNGYSIREMAEKDAHLVWNDETTFENEQRELNGHIIGFIEGFKAHKELSKDKLNLLLGKLNHKYQDEKDYDSMRILQEIMVALLPPTEWNIEFQNGKIILV